jgi:hypothetical protein
MNRPGVEQLVRGLRVWTADHGMYVLAAVELLIEHDHWLRNGEFVRRCLHRSGRCWWIDWAAAREAFDAGLGGSSTERAVLDYAIALGGDRYRFDSMGPANALLLVKATARALGVAL